MRRQGFRESCTRSRHLCGHSASLSSLRCPAFMLTHTSARLPGSLSKISLFSFLCTHPAALEVEVLPALLMLEGSDVSGTPLGGFG